MANIAYVALPVRAFNGPAVGSVRVGYFPTKESVPEGWSLVDKPETDITEVMEVNHWSYEKALEMMNK